MKLEEAKAIYKKIAQANNIWIRPLLTVAEELDINAVNKKWRITVTEGALKAFTTDEMAFLLGHELGHQNFSSLFSLGDKWDREYAADAKGAKYLIKAGFNLKKALKIFKKLPKGGIKYPKSTDRVKALQKWI